MDVIILAAGENVRLQPSGLSPGHKPLLLVEGEVLIRRLCRQANEIGAMRTIIVCAPTNVPEIVYATHTYSPHYVVQPEAVGPQEAVDRAIGLVRSSRVLLLMGDNFIPDLDHIKDSAHIITVTHRRDDALQPIHDGRFTYDRESADAWWLGPLVFPTSAWTEGCRNWVEAFKYNKFKTVEGHARDLGTLRAV